MLSFEGSDDLTVELLIGHRLKQDVQDLSV